jgi:hypothetical protein
MPDLYSEIGQNAKRVLTSSDNTGPETTWLVVHNNNENWYGGETWTDEPELATSDSNNYQAIVDCIQQYCEIYEVVRPEWSRLALKVRHNSVPYAGTETKNDQGTNSILTAAVQAHPDLGAAYAVWNGRFRGNQVSYD